MPLGTPIRRNGLSRLREGLSSPANVPVFDYVAVRAAAACLDIYLIRRTQDREPISRQAEARQRVRQLFRIGINEFRSILSRQSHDALF